MLNIFRLSLKDKRLDTCTINNDYLVNQTKHYPPECKEWSNNIYAFNKNTTKLLPIANTVITKLIRSYFNIYSRKLEKNIKSPRLRMRMRRLSTNRILVSKAEVKHTNDKLLITLYLYNKQKKYYINKIKKRYLLGLNIKNLRFLIKKVKTNLINLIYYKNKVNARNSLDLKSLKKSRDFKYLISLIRSLRFLNLRKSYSFLNIKNKVNSKIKFIKIEVLNIISNVRKEKDTFFNTLSWNKDNFKNYEKFYIKNFILKYLEKGILYMYYKQILFLNKSKFNNIYILPLKNIISKIYNKKVEFNLITLKYYHLNSDIFTQILVTKLRNRRNRVLRVLKTSLRRIKLPSLNKLFILNEIYTRKKKLQNLKVKNLLFDPLYIKKKPNNDTLNNILEKSLPVNLKRDFLVYLKKIILNKFFPFIYKKEFKTFLKNPNFNVSLSPIVKKEYDKFCKDTILNSLKHKVVNGIRIEASGRLTKRITAARSLFKLRYKGNLKNTDSSLKGFSSVLLRGHFKSNLQYTNLNSKTRIGSFGLKGWINSN